MCYLTCHLLLVLLIPSPLIHTLAHWERLELPSCEKTGLHQRSKKKKMAVDVQNRPLTNVLFSLILLVVQHSQKLNIQI